MSTGGFPATRFSIVGRLAADDPDVRARALEAFAAAYWVPVSRYIRFKWRLDTEHAADLTQEFFARTLESQALRAVRPVPGPLPNLRAPAGRRLRVERAQVRGPIEAGRRSREVVPLEETLPDGAGAIARAAGRRGSRRGVLSRVGACALRRAPSTTCGTEARARGREVQFEVFRRYDLADLRGEVQPTYADLAAALGLTVATVTNHLAAMRRSLRARVLDRLRELPRSEEEFEAEAKRLLGTRTGER